MKINLIYTAALAAAFGGLMAASGIDAAVTLGGMLGYAVLALGMWGAALLLIGWGSYLEQEEASRERLRKAHRSHARNRQPEYMQLPEHTEREA